MSADNFTPPASRLLRQVRLGATDAWTVLGLLVLLAAYIARYFNFSALPDEDGAILMRYALHMAQGHGLVWNVGEPPVEGATDFGYTVLLAALVKLGLTLEAAPRVIGIASHAITVCLIYIVSVRLVGAHRGLAAFSAIFVAIGPGLNYAQVHYGTPLFALVGTVAFCFAVALYRSVTLRDSILFALSCLLLGLVRPEGVLLAFLMLLGLVVALGLRRSLIPASCFVAVFATLGMAYFVWRVWYFGLILPNPAYIKADGGLHLAPLIVSIRNVAILTLAFSLVGLLALRTRETARKASLALVPVAGFAAIWVFMDDMQNYLMRYQYAVLPLVAIWWTALLPDIRRDWSLPHLGELTPRRRLAMMGLAGILGAGMLAFQFALYRDYARFERGLYDAAMILRDYRDRGYTLATTEAGLLPLYSEWRSIDAWGLNDAWIAKNGIITEAYLDANKPAVIVFHAFFSPIFPPKPDGGHWSLMTETLRRYAEKNGYHLAASFGERPDDTHYYYVRSDLPESKEITARIRALDYYTLDGVLTTSYAPPIDAR